MVALVRRLAKHLSIERTHPSTHAEANDKGRLALLCIAFEKIMTEHVRQRKRAEESTGQSGRDDRSGDQSLEQDDRRVRKQSALPFSYVRPGIDLTPCCFDHLDNCVYWSWR